MTDHPTQAVQHLGTLLIQMGLEGAGQDEVLERYCHELLAAGVPLTRLHVTQRAYHPEYGGVGFDWLRDGGLSHQQYGYSDGPPQQWIESPFYRMLQNGDRELRQQLYLPGFQSPYPLLQRLQAEGMKDYLAVSVLFEKPYETALVDPNNPPVFDPNNTPEGMLLSWATDATCGFREAHLAILRGTLPMLGLALKSASNRKMAKNLLQIYLGRDAGKRVLSGEFRRGSSRKINAVICYFDLTGFTSLSERIPGDKLVEMLNDYFELAVGEIRAKGGHILKFMGDGLLAMFDQAEMREAASAALDVVATLRSRMETVNRDRRAKGLAVTDYTLALHAGEILYGNIGAETRLDFTVIGPAVNLAARLGGMHAALEQSVIVSEAVFKAAGPVGHDLVPLGRFMLRGVSVPQMLYTLYTPDIETTDARDLV